VSDIQEGACVVLIPEPTPLTDASPTESHITLAYLGDANLSDELLSELSGIVAELVSEINREVYLETDDFELFGPEKDTLVWKMNDGPESEAVILREKLLARLSPELLSIFEEAETFPDYRPHITLGNVNEGYRPSSLGRPNVIQITAMSVWNGIDRIEFPIYGSELAHVGILRKSGRYPWGSGETPNQRNKDFLAYVEDLKRKGLSEVEIATGMGIKSTELRAVKSMAKNQLKAADIARATKLSREGNSNSAIGREMGINESSVRSLLDPAVQARNKELSATTDMLKDELSQKGYLDIGIGTEHHMGISDTKLKIATAQLQEEGYKVFYLKTPQLGTGNFTTIKVLAPPDTKFPDVVANQDKIKNVTGFTTDGGKTFTGPTFQTPKSVSSKRIEVRTKDDGGDEKDGVIELRRGVDDVSLGQARYAQVRIAVGDGKDGTHYLKGMAVYADDLPDGVDLRFNTNKTKAELKEAVSKGKAPSEKLAAMKAIKKDKATGENDPDSPFGSIVRQKTYIDKNGKEQLSALNLVNEEGKWDTWNSTLSSQFLSKQSPSLAKEQLNARLEAKQRDFDEIMKLTNPAVRKKLLETYADDADSSSVHLKAAGLPRTKQKVILPISSLKDNEIYAPTFNDGELVVLVRHPHGGIFEIPELRVNNKNAEAKRIIPNAIDAVGINSRVAERLSGADFDGDTVLVIPNNARKVKTSPQLTGLKNFNARDAYPAYEGMKPMSPRTKQLKMGDVSNLITDMTIRGAGQADLAAAVRHSMVVIDAEKHNLNWKQSAKDNGISALKAKYQDGARSGASTLISQASSEKRINDRKPRSAANGGPIDPKTGKLMYEETGDSYVSKTTGKTVVKSTKVAKISLVDDANDLSSGTPMEKVYADYANKLKSVANQARKTALETKPIPYSPSAKIAYAPEVKALQAKLNVALRNAPLERQAQLLANATVRAKKDATPDMDNAELKKVKGQALENARNRTGAKKTQVEITPSEWAAIQAGAISNNQLTKILNNTDIEQVKQLATPRDAKVMTDATKTRARAMLSGGATQAEVAQALGIPASTLSSSLTE
jgi:2'-5' RNA ligase